MTFGQSAPLGRDGLVCVPWSRMTGETLAWDELATRAIEPNPFFESWYLLPSLQAFDRAGEVSLLCFTHEGVLSGLMPAVRQPRYAGWPLPHLSNWLHHNMFFGTPLIARGAEDHFWRAVIDWADGAPGRALFLHLNEVALEGPAHAALEQVLLQDGRSWAIVQRHERALLASDLGPDAYLAKALSARKRKDLGRRHRRLSDEGKVEFRWESGTAGLTRWIDAFLALEAGGWKGQAGSALGCDAATERVFRESLTGAGQRDRLVRLSLRLDGRPIAMLSTFLTPPGAFGFKTAFDEAYARFSPGILLESEYLGVLKRFGVAWSDSCAAADHSVMNRIWLERRPIGRVSVAIGGPVRRALFNQILRKETSAASTG